MSTGRFLRPILAASLAIASLTPLIGVADERSGDDIAGCATPGQVTIRDDHWVRIASPLGENGDGQIVAFDAPKQQAGWIYATDGETVRSTVDGGCEWNTIFQAGEATGGVSPVFTHVVTQGRTALWLAGYDRPADDADGVGRPHIYMTPDATPVSGEATKVPPAPVEVGLPAVGKPIELVVSPNDPDVAYLLLEEPPDLTSGDISTPTRRVYRTKPDETGLPSEVEQFPELTWERIDPPAGFGRIDGLTMSPAGQMGWIWSGPKYAIWAVTEWVVPDPMPAKIHAIDVNNSGTAAVFTDGGDTSIVHLLDRTAQPLDRMLAPAAPAAVTHGSRSMVYALSGPSGTFGYDVRVERWVNVTPKGVDAFEALRIVRGANFGILFGQRPDAIYRFDLYPRETFLPPPPPPPGVADPNDIPEIPDSDLEGAVISPKAQVITVAPGELKDVPVALDVGPKSSKLDVFFIVDTTASMQPAIKALQENVKKIAGKLDEALNKRIKKSGKRDSERVCFGVGDVKDPHPQDPTFEQVYRVHQKITCDLDKVQDGVDKLKQGLGNPPEPEAQTIALVQAVTGAGQTGPPVIRSGLDAGWRLEHDPLKVIVLITDAAFMESTAAYRIPTIDDAIETMNDHGVKFVGVLAITNNNEAAAREDLEAVAIGTETFAPAAGVDCDSDNKRDLGEGDPLVCEAGGGAADLAPPIINMLLGVAENGLLGVDTVDPHRVVHHTVGKTTDMVNLRLENHLRFRAALTCAPAQDGKDLPVTLVGRVRGVPADIGRIIVRCRAIPVPPPPPAPPEEILVPEEPVFPRPVLAPIPVPEVPAPVPNNPVSNINPNAGLSHEEEQQFQMAGVSAGAGEEEQDDVETSDVSMSALDPNSPAAHTATFTFGCAAMLTAAAGYGLGRRRRAQQAARTSYARAGR